MKTDHTDTCGDTCRENPLVCTLTGPELQRRKATVIASLKEQMLERRELGNGYAFRFGGDDAVLDELVEFIRTERQCCSFFDFALAVNSDTTIWLHITGPTGAKEFVAAEMGL